MRDKQELRIVTVWFAIGAVIGLALTPANSADCAQTFLGMLVGTVFGVLLVLRLRHKRR